MFRTVIVGLLLILAVSGTAQPPDPRGPAWGNLPYSTQVSQAANQLFYQVERARTQLASLQHPQAATLQRLVDAYYEDILQFNRFLARNPGRGQIEQAYRRLDRRGDDVVAALRTFANSTQNAALSRVASHVEYADQLLGAAVIGGGPNPPPAANFVRLSRSLDSQSDDLLHVARETLKNDPISQRLEREIRRFTAAVDQFRRAAETGPGAEHLQRSFAGVQGAWSAVTQNLNSHNFLWESTALRQATVQVSGLVTTIGRLIGGGIVPPNPGPGPLPPGTWPPINPDRKRSIYVVGADAGGGPHVRVFQSARSGDSADFMAYDPDFRGGVRVAVGDVDGDGVQDVITAPGPGMPPVVRVFSGRDLSLIREFLAFDGNYQEGVWIAAADFNRNGRAAIICGADRGGLPIIRVFDAVAGQKLAEFAAYEAGFRGGVRVAVGDINGDGVPDIIAAPGPGRPATIRVFDGRNSSNVLSQFDAYNPGFVGGAFVSAADFARNGRKEIVTGADSGGGPHVRMFDPLNGRVLYEFFPFDQRFTGGVRVACRDIDGDGTPDMICTSGPGVSTTVRIFSGNGGQLLHEFTPFEPWWAGGAFVGCR